MRSETDNLTPPLAWVGSKRRWAHLIAQAFREESKAEQAGLYVEPFVGSGAVALAVARANSARAIQLSDASAPLISWWQACVRDPEDLIASVAAQVEPMLAAWREGDRDAAYVTYRALRERASDGDPAAFQIVNRCGYRGIWRTSVTGRCNSPLASHCPAGLTSVVRAEQIRSAATVLGAAHVAVERCDAWDVPVAQGPTWLYLDPPYLGTFTGYGRQWRHDDQSRLIAMALRWYAAGALVLISQPWQLETDWLAAGARRIGTFPRHEAMRPSPIKIRDPEQSTVDVLLALGGAQ